MDDSAEADGGGRGSALGGTALTCMEIWGGTEPRDSMISVPGVDVYVWCRPHHGARDGGDIHYVSTCMAGNISRLVLADVSGHGTSASAVAGRLRRLMRRHINTPDQRRFSRALNREFAQLADAGQFATAVVATYFAPTDHLIVCNAGHPRPLWFHRYTGRWTLLDAEASGVGAGPAGADRPANLPLGILDPAVYEQFIVWLSPGDLVVLYTDDAIESCDAAGQPLGEAGLLELVRGLDVQDPAAFAGSLLAALDARRAGREAGDDATLMVIHHNAANPPALSFRQRVYVLGRMLGLVSDEPRSG